MIKLQVITGNDKILSHTALFLFNYWEHICNSWSAHNEGMTLQQALGHGSHLKGFLQVPNDLVDIKSKLHGTSCCVAHYQCKDK